jgi:hypothetical protein
VTDHDRLMALRSHILAAHTAAAEDRVEGWIEHERLIVAAAANVWAEAHGLPRRCTAADVERIERPAVGHVDHAAKLALYVAEFVLFDIDPTRPPSLFGATRGAASSSCGVEQ